MKHCPTCQCKVLPTRIAQLIWDKRHAEGLKQREAAKAAGLPPSTMSRMEAGKMPDIVTLKALRAWLGCTYEELLGLKPDE